MEQIKTNRLLLKGLSLNDADDMYLYAKEPSVGFNAGWPPHKDLNETKEILKVMIKQNDIYGIYLNNKLIGTIDITIREKDYYLGYALAKDYWGQGIMTEAAKALIQQFFTKNKGFKIYAKTLNTNLRSQNVLKKMGFSFIKDTKTKVFGQVLDSYLFELDYNKFKEICL